MQGRGCGADPWSQAARELLSGYARCLREGGVILYPTDTIWGLGCDARNADAVARVARIKGRDSAKGFLSLVDGVRMLEAYTGALSPSMLSLLALWRGRPMSVVYPGVRGLPSALLAEDGSAGFRMVRHALCQALMQGLGAPLVSTSANAAGEEYRPGLEGIPAAIRGAVDLVVDPMFDIAPPHAEASMVVRYADGGVEVLRA